MSACLTKTGIPCCCIPVLLALTGRTPAAIVYSDLSWMFPRTCATTTHTTLCCLFIALCCILDPPIPLVRHLYYSLHLSCELHTQQPYAASSGGGPLRHLSHMRVQTFRASTKGSGVSAFSHMRCANLSWSPDSIVSCVSASAFRVGARRLSICPHSDGMGGGTGNKMDCPLRSGQH